MQAAGVWLEQPATQELFHAFEGAGHQLFCVGGCVRNALLGAPVADIDMSTNAHPDTVLALASRLEIRAVPTGIEHGTVTLIVADTPFEVTTFRKDIKTDGRRAVVAFADTLEEDAQRRDLTINALYCDASGVITDPVGGVRDIQDKRVRFIGDAHARLREDYLRILRFFRFYAWYGAFEGGIDPDGLAACAALAEGLETLSGERIGTEMRKLLSAPDPGPAIAAMAHAGVLHRIMPGAEAAGLPVLVHLEGARALDWSRRAAMLGGEDVTQRWRLSKAEARELAHLRAALEADTPLPELAYRLGAQVAQSVALIRAAGQGQPLEPGLEAQIAQAENATFPVTATDLMPRLQGPELGAELTRLEGVWIASGFTLTKADLLAL
ncbi:MAG: CCA tRNA nucleotidyltransferase [Pseudomonadota bacterium]